MISRLLNFASAQRVYLLIFSALCFIYGLIILFPGRQPFGQVSENPRYQAFKQAEKKLQKELSHEETMQQLYERKPILTGVFLGYSALFLFLFMGGISLWILLGISKTFRERVFKVYPLENKDWGMRLLLRFLVHFLAISLALNLALSGFAYVFPVLDRHALALIHTGVVDAFVALILLSELGWSKEAAVRFGFDLKGRSFIGEIFYGLSGYMMLIPLFALLLFILITAAQRMSYEPEPHPLVDVFLSEDKRAQGMIVFSIFLACLWGPFFEEVFFRGFCYPLFKKYIGVWPSAAVTAFFFALIHLHEFAFLPIFLLGFGLAILYEKRGCLIAPITLHLFHNSLFIGYFFTAKALMSGG